MTLDEFVQQTIEDLRLFKEIWEKRNESDPENYPLEMNEEEWEEQFFIALEII